MLAYTAVDGLRAISRDFDFDWRPVVNADLTAPRHNWRTGFSSSQHIARQALVAFLALVPFGATAWQR